VTVPVNGPFAVDALGCLSESLLTARSQSVLTEQVLKRMTPDIYGSVPSSLPLLVPALKHLTLSAHFDLNDQVILDMVQSRMWLPSLCSSSSVAERSNQVESLEFVALNISRKISPETISQMNFWLRSGLKVYVRSLRKCVVGREDDNMFDHWIDIFT